MKQKSLKKIFLMSVGFLFFSHQLSFGSLFSANSFISSSNVAHEEVSLAEIDVHQFRYLLSRVIADHEMVKGETVPAVLVSCYERLYAGNEKLYLDELLEMFPVLVDYVAKDMVVAAKAPRLDAPAVTAPNAIVGKDGCDLTPVLALLSIIKKRVINIPKIICEKIEQLEDIICDKFEQTWTVLADIDQDIFDTRTILCDKFEQTWTILADIDNDIFDTKTVLCDKFEQTWTILADIDQDIFDTRTILCDKFEQTWTILADIDNDIFDTKTVLCDKFEQTWTILADIDNDIFDTKTIICAKIDELEMDFNGVFTVLNDIDGDIFDTKTVLCDKFEQTWTILADIDQDIFDTRTIICDKLENLVVSATVDLSGVFTVLCDKFEQTWTILADIDQDIFDTRTILCDKFEQTWTILADIDNDIFDTKTVLCDKFEQTWTILADIDQDIFDTRTILCEKIENLNLTATLVCDLSGVFTALADIDQDIFDTRTILCDKFEQTWTILADIDQDIFDTRTILCNKLILIGDEIPDIIDDIIDTQTILCDKFEQTWTVLADIDQDIFDTRTILCDKIESLNLTATLVCDLSGVFTALVDIDQDIFDTRTILCDKFEQTWTVLADIDSDLFDTRTIICAKIEDIDVDLSGVFTALVDIDNDIFDTRTILCDKFEQTWTILADIDQDIFDTRTILCDKIENLNLTATLECDLSGVFTALVDIDDDIFDTRTILCDKFEQTWTILVDIDQDVFDTKTTLCAKFDGTFTVLQNICLKIGEVDTDLSAVDAALCTPNVINQADLGATTLTISVSGHYVFGENLIFSPASAQAAIEIAVDDVSIDMCGKTLSQGNVQAGVDGIVVKGGASGSARSNVKIANGNVKGFTQAGISVGKNSMTPADTAVEMATLKNITVVDCDLRGIELVAASAAANIKKSVIENCKILCCCTSVSADFALHLINTADIKVTDCEINGNGGSSVTSLIAVNVENSTKVILTAVDANCNEALILSGFRLNLSEECLLNHCRFITNSATNALTGYVLTGGSGTQGNIIDRCLASNNTSTNGPFIGFNFLPSVTRNIVKHCNASNNFTTAAVAGAHCYGFNFDQVTFCDAIKCRALENRATGDGGSNRCAGFNVSTSSGVSTTGNKDCMFYFNKAVHNNGPTNSRSFGLRAVAGAVTSLIPLIIDDGNERIAYIGNIAVRNGPTAPVVANQIVPRTVAILGDNPGGVPATAIVDLVITNLGFTVGELQNKRIV